MILGLCAMTATPAVALAQDEEVSEAAEETPRWGAGFRVRYISVPNWLLELFLDHATQLSSYSIAAEFTRRKGDLDIVISVDWTDGDAEDGFYLEKGDNPGVFGQHPDYTEFEGFAMLSADVSFIWNAQVHERVAIRYGGGIGVGLILGEIYQTDTSCPPGTTAGQLDDPAACTPFPATRHVDEDVPPALPVVNILLGTRIKLAEKMSLNVEGGFRNAFFLGLGFDYFF